MEIKGCAGLRSIPVVVMTTSKAEIDICRRYDLETNSYITQAVTFADIERFPQVNSERGAAVGAGLATALSLERPGARIVLRTLVASSQDPPPQMSSPSEGTHENRYNRNHKGHQQIPLLNCGAHFTTGRF